MVETLSKFNYPQDWGFRREPTRPAELRVIDFENLYDYHTIWNDAIQVNQNTVLLIGPPLYGTAEWINNNCRIEDQQGNHLYYRVVEMDRACVTVVMTNGWMDFMVFRDPQGLHTITLNRQSMDFAGKKVIITISKDHPISWLKQWIDYHRTVHNVDGLLLYNNQSTLYTSKHLESQISRDDMVIKVVDYDVPFGVMGGGDWEWQGRRGTYLPWDSDFSQYVMLEHAKWRYLHRAKLAINADTDELIYIKGASMDDLANYCESNADSVWLYNGTWIEPIDSRDGTVANTVPLDQRQFGDYWHTSHSNQRGIGVKWSLNPGRNMEYQWHLHRTFGPHKSTEFIGFGHYLAMNTSWSWPRDGYTGDRSTLLEFDEVKKNLEIWNARSGRR